MLKNSKWIVVWYAAIAVACFSALSFLGLFVNELTAQSVKWEEGLTVSFVAFGCVASFLMVLYVIPYVLKFFVDIYEYFRYR